MQNVLIVDDTATEREILGRIVTGMGHHPVFAVDGAQAVEAAKQAQPALILLDVVMPIMDGFKTCRALKADPATADIPVVLVTSKGRDTDKVWGRRQGAVEYVTKPYSPDTIVSL